MLGSLFKRKSKRAPEPRRAASDRMPPSVSARWPTSAEDGEAQGILNGLKDLHELNNPEGEKPEEDQYTSHHPCFAGKLFTSDVIIKIFSEDSYHGLFMTKLENFIEEYNRLLELYKLGISVIVLGRIIIKFSEFKGILSSTYKLPPPVKFHGDFTFNRHEKEYSTVEDIPDDELIYMYIMEECLPFDINNDDIINNLRQLFNIMNIMLQNNFVHGDINYGNFVVCGGSIKIIDPISPTPSGGAASDGLGRDFRRLKKDILGKINYPIHIMGGEVGNAEELCTALGLTGPTEYQLAIRKLQGI